MKNIKLLIISVISVVFLLAGCADLTAEADHILTGLYDDYCKAEEILLCADLDDEKKLLEENGQTYELPVVSAVKENADEIIVITMPEDGISSQVEIILQKETSGWRISEISEVLPE